MLADERVSRLLCRAALTCGRLPRGGHNGCQTLPELLPLGIVVEQPVEHMFCVLDALAHLCTLLLCQMDRCPFHALVCGVRGVLCACVRSTGHVEWKSEIEPEGSKQPRLRLLPPRALRAKRCYDVQPPRVETACGTCGTHLWRCSKRGEGKQTNNSPPTRRNSATVHGTAERRSKQRRAWR